MIHDSERCGRDSFFFLFFDFIFCATVFDEIIFLAILLSMYVYVFVDGVYVNALGRVFRGTKMDEWVVGVLR